MAFWVRRSGTPPTRQQVCKVLQTGILGLDLALERVGESTLGRLFLGWGDCQVRGQANDCSFAGMPSWELRFEWLFFRGRERLFV